MILLEYTLLLLELRYGSIPFYAGENPLNIPNWCLLGCSPIHCRLSMVMTHRQICRLDLLETPGTVPVILSLLHDFALRGNFNNLHDVFLRGGDLVWGTSVPLICLCMKLCELGSYVSYWILVD